MKRVLLSTATICAIISTTSLADVSIKSKAAILKFSGKHYIGFVHDNSEKKDANSYFETRRNYLQVKAYFKENSKDHLRITLDTKTSSTGEVNVRLKYAYLYLADILPYTSVKFGQAHRPWIDYNTKTGWLYRSIAKSFTEEKLGANLTSSTDKGINFNTKIGNFSSEVGIFNGEGYSSKDTDGKNGLSYEWRFTSHIYKAKAAYADISFMGAYNTKTLKNDEDLLWYGINALYSQPKFLIAGTFVKTDDAGVDNNKKTGSGWSINGSVKILPKTSLLARFDNFKSDNKQTRQEYIAGVGYKYTKNIQFIANVFHADPDKDTKNDAKNRYMLTAEVKW